VNTGGKKLDAFELLTAIYASDDFNLREDWYGNTESRDAVPGRLAILSQYEVLRDLASTDFLQAISLLYTLERREQDIQEGKEGKQRTQVSCQRGAILNLPLSAYQRWADAAMQGFIEAAKFLSRQKIFWKKDVPYKTQLVPLATIFVRLGQKAEVDFVQRRLAQWYWCGVFGELYGSAVETRFSLDVQEVPTWIDGGGAPKTVLDANFAPERLLTLKTRLSAAYKGVNALLMKRGAEDFKSGKPFEYATFWDEAVDIHHIFPRSWCKKASIEPSKADCIVNKTPLTSQTNRIIGGEAPSNYLARLQRDYELGDSRLSEILTSHLIEADPLRENQFEAFFAARAERLLELIEEATGKQIVRSGPGDDEAGEYVDFPDDQVDADGVPTLAPEQVE